MPIGNDIVDLACQENRGKSGDRRFLARVFTDRELRLIAGADNPDTFVWVLWAVKEGAYKATAKLACDVPAVPRRYEITNMSVADDPSRAESYLPHETGWPGRRVGVVETPMGTATYLVCWNHKLVHALVRGGGENTVWGTLLSGMVTREDNAVCPSGVSLSTLLRGAVRNALAPLLKIPEEQIAVVRDATPRGLGPPRLVVAGTISPIDVSLSHDGAYGAYALLFPAPINAPISP